MEEWHIIDADGYIDGPDPNLETARQTIVTLCHDQRKVPPFEELAPGFWHYLPPRDRELKYQHEFFLCTQPAALDQGVPEDLFRQRAEGEWRRDNDQASRSV